MYLHIHLYIYIETYLDMSTYSFMLFRRGIPAEPVMIQGETLTSAGYRVFVVVAPAVRGVRCGA